MGPKKGTKAGKGKPLKNTSTETKGQPPPQDTITPQAQGSQEHAKVPQYPPAITVDELAVIHENVTTTEQSLKRELAEIQKNIRDDQSVEENLLSLYESRTASEQLYKASMLQDLVADRPTGRSQESKAAKVEVEKAKKKWREEQGSRAVRAAQSADSMEAQARLEDFLFYQNSSNRWNRLRAMDPNKRQKVEAERLQRRIPYLLDAAYENRHHEWLHEVLNTFDERGVGTILYRQGIKDALGNDRPSGLIQPNELHLWTPVGRRTPVGLGRDPEEAWFPEPYNLRLDYDAIEERRNKIELQTHREDEAGILPHQKRRQNELLRYKATERPTTSSVRVRPGSSPLQTVDHFRNIRTSEGLFIAAKESSWDWRTSYDYLGRVKSGEVHTVLPLSHERGFPVGSYEFDLPSSPQPGSKRKNMDQELITETEEGEEMTYLNQGLTKRHSETPVKKGKGKGKGKKLKTSQEVQNPDQGDPPNANSTTVAMKVTYPYPANEFKQGPRVHPSVQDLTVVTKWAEETIGRRERHVYGAISPSSDVDSPPKSPIDGQEIRNIPDGFAVTRGKPTPLERRSGARFACVHNKRCRAFWSHPKDGCYIAYPEQPSRPDDALSEIAEWPTSTIDPPKGKAQGGANGYVPKSGIRHYQDRLSDHYGILHNIGKSEGPHWPRLGIRVPYEPMTFDDMRLRDGLAAGMNEEGPSFAPQGDGILAPDAHLRTAHEVRTLAFPIFEGSQRPYGWVADSVAQQPEEIKSGNEDEKIKSGNEDEKIKSGNGNEQIKSGNGDEELSESEHGGDLFRVSYHAHGLPGGA